MVTDMKKRCWKGYAPVKGKKPYSKGSCRKVRRNPAPFKPIKMLERAGDLDEAEKLFIYFENDANLMMRRYPQFELNLDRKVKRGIFDRTKAAKLFLYLANEIAKDYAKFYKNQSNFSAPVTSVPTRKLLANLLLEKYEGDRYPIKESADLEEPRGIIRGKRVLRKNPSCGVTMNPARTKTWKLGEYGGNIKAKVNQSGTAIEIFSFNDDDAIGEKRLFRWPLDKFNMEMYLNELTTSYYASKIIDWVQSVTKGTSMNPVPAGYHTMPDGRVMADSEHSVSTNPRGIDPNLEYKKEYGWTFVEFLKKRLIPDLRESGMYATIADYQRGISLYNDKKGVLPSTQYLNYLKYLRETLIPDLKESGSDSTAADFERMYKMVLYTWNNRPKIRKTKYRRDLDDR